MRRLTAVLLVLLLVAIPTTALAKEFNSKLFASAKEAVSLISYGENKKALKKLGLKAESKSVVALTEFVDENLSEISYITPQTDVAVCYQIEKGYKLAVPLEAPDSAYVNALVLLSKDGQSFSGYRAMSWGEVEDEIAQSESVIWKDKYDPGTPVILADE